MNSLQDTFGNIDIYLFDQLLKGRFDDCKNVIDLGCGAGRNIVYFLRHGYHVFGIDRDPAAIDAVRQLAEKIAPDPSPDNFRVGQVEDPPFENETFDLAISSAVFHFASSKDHFEQMLMAAWRLLRPGGFLFARLASSIGIEQRISALGDGRYRLPDGSDRFLVDEAALLYYTAQLRGRLYEPIKTTNVQHLRCMTTWCVQKEQ